MKAKLSINKYIEWNLFISIDEYKNIRKRYRHLSDIPTAKGLEDVLPKFLFVEGFEEALKICGSDNPEEWLDPRQGKDIEIEWIDDISLRRKIRHLMKRAKVAYITTILSLLRKLINLKKA